MTVRHYLLGALAGLALIPLIPALVRAQEDQSAREKAYCASNLKQLSIGIMMYVQDYDETYPPAGKWQTGVYPYVKNRKVFQCPSDTGVGSYAFNKALSGVSLAFVRNPATTAALFESNLHKPNAFGVAKDAVLNRHPGGSNWGFADGHVKLLATAPAFGPIDPPKKPGRKR
jgi:prepilin-type processing-associated H-X9-DG protein